MGQPAIPKLRQISEPIVKNLLALKHRASSSLSGKIATRMKKCCLLREVSGTRMT